MQISDRSVPIFFSLGLFDIGYWYLFKIDLKMTLHFSIVDTILLQIFTLNGFL